MERERISGAGFDLHRRREQRPKVIGRSGGCRWMLGLDHRTLGYMSIDPRTRLAIAGWARLERWW